MAVRRFQLCLVLAASLLAGAAPAKAAADREPLLLGDDERILVLAAHPDDETLAAGGLIQEARALDLPVRVCFFTMGDNNEIAALFTRRHPALAPGPLRASGQLRQNEALAAATQLGLSAEDVVFLLKPSEIVPTDIAEKEALIQSGKRHYSEMLSVEAVPDERYLKLYETALAANAARLRHAVRL